MLRIETIFHSGKFPPSLRSEIVVWLKVMECSLHGKHMPCERKTVFQPTLLSVVLCSRPNFLANSGRETIRLYGNTSYARQISGGSILFLILDLLDELTSPQLLTLVIPFLVTFAPTMFPGTDFLKRKKLSMQWDGDRALLDFVILGWPRLTVIYTTLQRVLIR